MASELPGGLTDAAIMDGIDSLLRTESWDDITIKLVMQRLEKSLLPDHDAGVLKPHKKFIKEGVDICMKRILEEPKVENGAVEEDGGSPIPDPKTEPEPGPEPTAEVEPDATLFSEPASKAVKREGADVKDVEEQAPPPKKAKRDPAKIKVDEDEDDFDDEEDDDDEAPKILGKPIREEDGKRFYRKMSKQGEELSVGQDVYLENNLDIPYVARLQEIFVYAFAPTEVYFNARWYYRIGDCHEYAKMEGAKDDVEYEGKRLAAEAKELFFSLHMDENHADCILRGCSVYLHGGSKEDLPHDAWSTLNRHEYIAWRAYDKKKVYALKDLPSKKLQSAFQLEQKRGPQRESLKPKPKPKPQRDAGDAPLSADEMRAICVPRRHLEIYLDTHYFSKVARDSLVRVSQLLNGKRNYYIALTTAIKRTPRQYRVGQKVTDLALAVKTHTGPRTIGMDALSNEPPSDEELIKFKVSLKPDEVRHKIYTLQRAMQDNSELFEEEEVRRRVEQDERLHAQREAEAQREEYEREERERKEREKEEVRRRAAERLADGTEGEQWWLKYQNKGAGKQRELAKWRARLKRFEKIVQTSEAGGERENAQRLAEQAQQKIDSLEAQEDEEEE